MIQEFLGMEPWFSKKLVASVFESRELKFQLSSLGVSACVL